MSVDHMKNIEQRMAEPVDLAVGRFSLQILPARKDFVRE